jgi:hypothetical protein
MLLWEANTHCRKTIEADGNIAKIRRVEQSRLDTVYCWFCENHHEILCDDFAGAQLTFRIRRAHVPFVSSVEANMRHSEAGTIPISRIDDSEWIPESELAFDCVNNPLRLIRSHAFFAAQLPVCWMQSLGQHPGKPDYWHRSISPQFRLVLGHHP